MVGEGGDASFALISNAWRVLGLGNFSIPRRVYTTNLQAARGINKKNTSRSKRIATGIR